MDHSEDSMEWTTSRTVHSEVVTSIADSSKQESQSSLCSSSTDTTLSVPSNSQDLSSQHINNNTSLNVKSSSVTTQTSPMRWTQKKSHSDPTPIRLCLLPLEEVFRNNYADLVKLLPMQNDIFIAELYTNHLLSDNQKDEIDSIPVSTKKAIVFLDKAIKPSIVINDSRKFNMLLKLMEKYDDVKKLGKTMSSMLKKESSGNETDEMDTSDGVYSQQYSSRKITTKPVEVDFVRKNLCCSYMETRCTPEGAEWPPYLLKSIVSVTLIYYKGRRTKEQLLEIAQLHKGGSVAVDKLIASDKYLPSPKKQRLDHSKISKKICDIFEADFDILGENSIEPPKSILIEGAPGIGKTMLIKEIAYCWANGSILCNVELVFKIYLRNPHVQKANSLGKLFQLFVPTEMASDIIKYVYQCGGHNVVFLIDGFDEYPLELRKSSFILDIIMHKILPKCTVLVTSRPTATAALRNHVDKRVEILGFAEEDRKRGVQLLSNITKDKTRLLHLFLCYSEAKSYAKLPSIITSMFKNGKIKFNQTLLPHNISSLASFLSHSKVDLTVLELRKCNLRNVGMNILKNLIVNNKELMSTLRCINLLENDSSPWDVYCTIIEHCSVDSLTIFGDDGMEEYIEQLQNGLEKNATLQSLTLLNIGKIGLQSIKTVLGNSNFLCLKEIKLSWLNTDVKTKILLHTTFLLNSTLTCSSVNKEIAIKVLWDGTSNSTSDISMSSKLDGNIDILLFIAFGLQNNKTVCKLDLSNNSECLSTEEGMTIICDCLKSNNNTLKELKLSNNCIGDKVHMLGEALQVNKTLQNLDISNNNISNNDMRTNIKEVNNREYEHSGVSESLTSCNAVSVSTSQASMQEANIFHINKLNIASNNLSSTVISSYIKNNTCLQELDISENAITNEGAVEIAKAITTNSVLNKLNISKNYITTEGLLCLIEIFIKAACPLKVLDVTHNNVTKSGFEKIESALKPSSSLKVYASWNEIVLDNEQVWFKSIVFLFSDSQEVDGHGHVDNWSIKDIKDVDYRVKFLSDSLEEDSTLHDLDLCNNDITSMRAKVVAKAIKLNATLRKLNISCNTLSDEGALAFSECLKYNRSLQEFRISENNIPNEGITMIAEAMKTNATMLKLDISKNWITSEAILYLLKVIKNKGVLKFLNVTHNNVTKSEYIKIQEYCKQVTVQVQVSWNELELNSELEFKTVCKVCNTHNDIEVDYWPCKKISDPDAKMEFLSNCLKENNTLQNLDLCNNSITDIGALLIGQAMEINRSLKILNISCNEFSDDGVTAISMYIRNNAVLQELDLSDNKISNRGASEIGDLIQNNKSLKVLDISCMCICDSGVTIISKCLENNSSLQVLNLSLNKITKDGAKEIAEALKKNTTLQKLNITGNKISDDGVATISSSLKRNDSLQELYMSENSINSKGAQHIAAAIQVNRCLHTLDLHHLNVDNSLSFNNVILDAVRHNNTLKQLKLPWVIDKYENDIKNKVKKINKERTKRGNYTSLYILT